MAVSHTPDAVKIRRAYPPYRACRNSSCWCWSPEQLYMRGARAAGPHDNGGNPPTVTFPARRAITAGVEK